MTDPQNPGWTELLDALAELPSVPTDADLQLKAVLKEHFNFDTEEDNEM